jgi:hypothetical protein
MKSWLADLAPRPEESLNAWQRPGPWFWLALLLGAGIRLYLVLYTEGTSDVALWRRHAVGVHYDGLIAYYHANQEMNHPPLVGVVISWLWFCAEKLGASFAVFLRAPFALLDAGTALLLLATLRDNRHRFTITAAYWLHPLAMIYAAFHGNTDSSLAFFLMLGLYFVSTQRPLWAAAVLGASLSVKLPCLLALPAFVLVLPHWRARWQFLGVTGAVALLGYLPALLADPAAVVGNVFGYRGQLIVTTAGTPIWGARIFFDYWTDAPAHAARPPFLAFYLMHNKWFCVVPILLLSWFRRQDRSLEGMALTLTGIFSILYGFSNAWSFQYFAWSIPLWFMVGARFVIPATLLAGGYVYGLYSMLCGNPWLLGKWNFAGHPHWPDALLLLRDGALLFFFGFACWMLAVYGWREVGRLRGGTL